MSEEEGGCHKCCHPFAKEFSRDKFCLEHQPVDDFFKSQWQKHDKSVIWLIYRWLLAICFSIGVIGSASTGFWGGKWFIYLTDWGFLLCMYTCVFGAVLATIYHCNTNYFAAGSCVVKFYWLSYTSTLAIALVITFVYWLFIHPTADVSATELYNLWAHGFNSILMLLDHMLVAFPTRLLHFVYPLGLGVIYSTFSLIYYFAEGEDPFGNSFIYQILDWSEPIRSVLTVLGTLLLSVIFFVLLWMLYKLRCCIYNNCHKSV